jgi:hypothetical protein
MMHDKENRVTLTITDPAMIEALLQSRGELELKDAEGNYLGTCSGVGRHRPPPGWKPALSPEEEQRRLQDKTPGRKLKDILRDLEARG